MKIEKLFEGEKRCETLLDAILEVIYERGEGLPIPQIIGVIELCKHSIIKKVEEDE